MYTIEVHLCRSKHLRTSCGEWRDRPLRVHAWDAFRRDNGETGTHEAVSSFQCCRGERLQEKCTRCDFENWGHFFPLHYFMPNEFKRAEFLTKCCGNNNLVSARDFFLQKKGKSHDENCRWSMSPLHVPTTCPLVWAELNAHKAHVAALYSLLHVNTY